jgi:hypothetical protein
MAPHVAARISLGHGEISTELKFIPPGDKYILQIFTACSRGAGGDS